MPAATPSAELPVPSATLLAPLAALPDPRVDRAKRHSLTDVLAIALLATLCGADTYTQFALFGVTRQAWLATFLALPNGIPSHDTFARLLRQLDPKAFVGGSPRGATSSRARSRALSRSTARPRAAVAMPPPRHCTR